MTVSTRRRKARRHSIEAGFDRGSGVLPTMHRWATPLDLACELDPRMRRTPALELINDALVWADATPDARLMVFMPPQEGKALALDTPIATPDGWSTIGELQPGDRVFDRHGEPCTVTAVSPVWTGRPCYEVRTGDGERIIADAAHEWVARLDRRSSERICDTALLANHRSKNAQITGPSKGLDLPLADLPIDPYALGAWLGDGHAAGARITCHPKDSEILDRIRSTGWPVRPGSGSYGWAIGDGVRRGGRGDTFCGRLRALGVLGNKHIPDRYFRGSREQRIALLQGLVDTDGYVDPRGQVEFCSVSYRLASGVRELVFSLGAKATIHEGRATINGKDCGPKYRVRFFMAHAAYLARKAERCTDSTVATVRYVWAEPTESVPTRCIEVDSPDHTYLAGRTLLPTHNSTLVSRYWPIWSLIRSPRKRFAVVSYSDDLARAFGGMVRNDIRDHGSGATIDLGLRLTRDTTAKNEWKLTTGGGMVTAGIHTGLTGRAVDHLGIDDPFKDRDDADSQVVRDAVWNFWEAVAVSRLAKGAPATLTMTRWHYDDLGGRFERRYPGRWRIIHIPAQADPAIVDPDPLGRPPGAYMLSARGRTDADWEQRKLEMGDQWVPLAQGSPAAPGGDTFDLTKLRYWHWNRDRTELVCGGRTWRLGIDCWVFITIDLAFSEKSSADYTVASAWAIPIDGSLILLDVARDRVPQHQQIDLARPLVDEWAPAAVYVEASMRGTQLIRELMKEGWKTRTGQDVMIEDLIADKDKTRRAAPAAKRLTDQRLWFPAEHARLDVIRTEMKEFPKGRHDDFVDTLAYAARVAYTDWTPTGTSPPPPEPSTLDPIHRATDTHPGWGSLDPIQGDW